jgi:hypothetical protein
MRIVRELTAVAQMQTVTCAINGGLLAGALLSSASME